MPCWTQMFLLYVQYTSECGVMYMHRICIVGHISRLLGLVSDDSSRAAVSNLDGSMLQQPVFESYIMMQQSVVKHGM